MQSYTLTSARDREVFDRALDEPILVTRSPNERYVVMSAGTYKKLIDRLTELEDCVWGQTAKIAMEDSQLVGEEKFTLALQDLANGET